MNAAALDVFVGNSSNKKRCPCGHPRLASSFYYSLFPTSPSHAPHLKETDCSCPEHFTAASVSASLSATAAPAPWALLSSTTALPGTVLPPLAVALPTAHAPNATCSSATCLTCNPDYATNTTLPTPELSDSNTFDDEGTATDRAHQILFRNHARRHPKTEAHPDTHDRYFINAPRRSLRRRASRDLLLPASYAHNHGVRNQPKRQRLTPSPILLPRPAFAALPLHSAAAAAPQSTPKNNGNDDDLTKLPDTQDNVSTAQDSTTDDTVPAGPAPSSAGSSPVSIFSAPSPYPVNIAAPAINHNLGWFSPVQNQLLTPPLSINGDAAAEQAAVEQAAILDFIDAGVNLSPFLQNNVVPVGGFYNPFSLDFTGAGSPGYVPVDFDELYPEHAGTEWHEQVVEWDWVSCADMDERKTYSSDTSSFSGIDCRDETQDDHETRFGLSYSYSPPYVPADYNTLNPDLDPDENRFFAQAHPEDANADENYGSSNDDDVDEAGFDADISGNDMSTSDEEEDQSMSDSMSELLMSDGEGDN
ncbi:hypothetical protein BGX29_002886 [Mortierella sp. GBA35]|nr:hypothetical protein BGX29_002886 [Mortierella sp. GBA35]